MNIFLKLIFFWKKPKVIVISQNNLQGIKKATAKVLGRSFFPEVDFKDFKKGMSLPTKEYLVLNFDNDNLEKAKEGNPARVFTFGFREGADFLATDLRINSGINFKINYKGNIVPIWLKEGGKEEVLASLAAAAVGVIFGLNLVEISQALKV